MSVSQITRTPPCLTQELSPLEKQAQITEIILAIISIIIVTFILLAKKSSHILGHTNAFGILGNQVIFAILTFSGFAVGFNVLKLLAQKPTSSSAPPSFTKVRKEIEPISPTKAELLKEIKEQMGKISQDEQALNKKIKQLICLTFGPCLDQAVKLREEVKQLKEKIAHGGGNEQDKARLKQMEAELDKLKDEMVLNVQVSNLNDIIEQKCGELNSLLFQNLDLKLTTRKEVDQLLNRVFQDVKDLKDNTIP